MTQILNRPSKYLTCLLAKRRCVHQRDDGEGLTLGRNNFTVVACPEELS